MSEKVRLVSPIGGATGGSGNLSSTIFSNVTTLAAHLKFVWVFNANCDGTIIYRAYGSWTTLPVFSNYSEGYGIKCIYGLDHAT
jgi:hypothetical protein